MKYLVNKQSVMMVLGIIALVSLLIGCVPETSNEEDTSHTEQRIDTIIQSDREAERTYEIIYERYAEELAVQRQSLREAYLNDIEDLTEEQAREAFELHLAELERVYEKGIKHMEEAYRVKEDASNEMHGKWVDKLDTVLAAEAFMLLFGDEELILPASNLIIH